MLVFAFLEWHLLPSSCCTWKNSFFHSVHKVKILRFFWRSLQDEVEQGQNRITPCSLHASAMAPLDSLAVKEEMKTFYHRTKHTWVPVLWSGKNFHYWTHLDTRWCAHEGIWGIGFAPIKTASCFQCWVEEQAFMVHRDDQGFWTSKSLGKWKKDWII